MFSVNLPFCIGPHSQPSWSACSLWAAGWTPLNPYDYLGLALKPGSTTIIDYVIPSKLLCLSLTVDMNIWNNGDIIHITSTPLVLTMLGNALSPYV